MLQNQLLSLWFQLFEIQEEKPPHPKIHSVYATEKKNAGNFHWIFSRIYGDFAMPMFRIEN